MIKANSFKEFLAIITKCFYNLYKIAIFKVDKKEIDIFYKKYVRGLRNSFRSLKKNLMQLIEKCSN